MAKKRIPLSIVTLFHPEKWLFGEQGSLAQLAQVSHSDRDRELLEEMRGDLSKEHDLRLWVGRFHGRRVTNAGRFLDRYRYTWLATKDLLDSLQNLQPRLIHTQEPRGKQARWRLEFRPDWSGKPILDLLTQDRILKRIEDASKISVRQVWINPFASNTYEIPGMSLSHADDVANLVLGPMEAKSRRKADLELEHRDSAWWILFDERYDARGG